MAKTLEEHYGYLSDAVKRARYEEAMQRLVRPGHVVLDLGCGAGVLGLMALRAGARKVYFVEEDAIIDVAQRTVAEAGFADQAEFFQANSFVLTLPEQVDLAVCDHVGYFGFDYSILALQADVAQRFLKPGGVLVPAEIELKLAPIESEACRKLIGQWRDGSVPAEFAWVGTSAANTKHGVNLDADNLLADAATLAHLQLGAEAPPYLSWEASFTCSRAGLLDGVAGWFDCKLYDDIRMTNSPLADNALNRPQAYLPLETPVQVKEGDRIDVRIMARHLDHVIGWVVELPERNQRFTHTTFNGLLLDQRALTRANQGRPATLNARGRARQIVLSYCDGQRSLADVQALVQREHPQLFPSAHAMSTFITEVLSWDTSE
jgi:protein arginine N-methyltransferase 1